MGFDHPKPTAIRPKTAVSKRNPIAEEGKEEEQKKKKNLLKTGWKQQMVTFDSKENAARDDLSKLSFQIRPKETLFKERPKPDYVK